MQPQPVENPLVPIAQGLANQLVRSLAELQPKILNKYEYYDADNDTRDFGISTPRRMRNHQPGIGWASRAVNTLSDRVVFDGFARDTFGINDLFTEIGANSIISQGKHDAMIGGVSFIGISNDAEGRKVLIPFAADEATGVIDQRTGLLKYGMAVTKWQTADTLRKRAGIKFDPCDFVVFTPNFTAIFVSRTISGIIPNATGRCLLQPITHRASARQPLGKSRLTKTARRIIQEVGRQKRREEIAEEFYALPQRYITGLAEGAQKDSKLDSAIGIVWAMNKDEDGDKPEIGQLAQMSIDQFETAKKDKARDFCAETALTLRNLGYETGNPTSAESLSAMSDDLLLEAATTQTEMGEQIKQIAITLYMAMNDTSEVPAALIALVPAWKPIFQLDVGAAGDAVFKLQQAMPELMGTIAGYRMLGVSIREAEELAARREKLTAASFMQNGGGK